MDRRCGPERHESTERLDAELQSCTHPCRARHFHGDFDCFQFHRPGQLHHHALWKQRELDPQHEYLPERCSADGRLQRNRGTTRGQYCSRWECLLCIDYDSLGRVQQRYFAERIGPSCRCDSQLQSTGYCRRIGQLNPHDSDGCEHTSTCHLQHFHRRLEWPPGPHCASGTWRKQWHGGFFRNHHECGTVFPICAFLWRVRELQHCGGTH